MAKICIARDHPITTHVRVETLRAHIRQLTRLPHHHLASLPSTRPQASFCKVVAALSGSLPSSYAPPSRPSSPLWRLLQPRPHLNIPGIKKKVDLPPSGLQQLFLLFLHEAYGDRVHVYTDGLVTTSSSAGAIIIPRSRPKFILSSQTRRRQPLLN